MFDDEEDELNDEYRENDDDMDDSEPLLLQFGKDGKVSLAPEMVSISEEDFDKLNKGLLLLKEKYPEISKECFPE